MTIPEKEDILYAAEKLAPFLDPAVRERLISAAHHYEILDILAEAGLFERAWMRAALFGEADGRLLSFGSVLPGNPNSIPAGSIWSCPHCDFDWIVRKVGQPVPPCPRHKVHLVRQP